MQSRAANVKWGISLLKVCHRPHLHAILTNQHYKATQQLTIYYQEHTLEQQSEMIGQLHAVRETIDSYAKMNEVFVERVKILEEERKTLRKKTPLEIANEIFQDHKTKFKPSSDQESAYAERLNRRKPPTTCTWIFELKEYKDWYASETSDVLWVSGNGGN